MQFWQSIARTPIDQLEPVATLAERLGFAELMMSDHLVRPLHLTSRYPYAAGGQMATDETTPYLDPWILFAHLSRATRQLRFMSCVYIPAMRDPFTVAKALSTAAILSGERLLFGIGVGWMQEEFRLTGQSFRGRGRRTDELLEVIRSLFTGEMVEHHGEFYDFDPVQMAPVPRRFPPLLVGGHSSRALRRAAASDGWLGVNYDLARALEILAALRAEREARGLADRSFDAALALNAVPSLDDLRRLRDAGVTMIVNPPLIGPSGKTTDMQRKRESLEAYASRFIEPLRS